MSKSWSLENSKYWKILFIKIFLFTHVFNIYPAIHSFKTYIWGTNYTPGTENAKVVRHSPFYKGLFIRNENNLVNKETYLFFFRSIVPAISRFIFQKSSPGNLDHRVSSRHIALGSLGGIWKSPFYAMTSTFYTLQSFQHPLWA